MFLTYVFKGPTGYIIKKSRYIANSQCVCSGQGDRLSKDLVDKVYCGQEYTVLYYTIVNHGWENNKREIVETTADVLWR